MPQRSRVRCHRNFPRLLRFSAHVFSVWVKSQVDFRNTLLESLRLWCTLNLSFCVSSCDFSFLSLRERSLFFSCCCQHFGTAGVLRSTSEPGKRLDVSLVVRYAEGFYMFRDLWMQQRRFSWKNAGIPSTGTWHEQLRATATFPSPWTFVSMSNAPPPVLPSQVCGGSKLPGYIMLHLVTWFSK